MFGNYDKSTYKIQLNKKIWKFIPRWILIAIVILYALNLIGR